MMSLINRNKQVPKLSIVVICFNMQREIVRTIKSLLPPYQEGISYEDIEIIVVDNGSDNDVEFGELSQYINYYKHPSPNKSPAAAANFGIKMSTSDLIGVFIDGARMASPGLCNDAIKISCISQRAVISTLAFHIGPDVQMETVFKGYNQELEDQLLEGIDWANNGYDLFHISSLAGSSINGLFQPIGESNGLFMSKDLWNELGGFDERFIQPGGGLVNLDTYKRACELPESEMIMLISEATFHQVHGGVATNQRQGQNWDDFSDEYSRIRGEKFIISSRLPHYYGKYIPSVNQLLHDSVNKSEKDLNRLEIQKKVNDLLKSRFLDLNF